MGNGKWEMRVEMERLTFLACSYASAHIQTCIGISHYESKPALTDSYLKDHGVERIKEMLVFHLVLYPMILRGTGKTHQGLV